MPNITPIQDDFSGGEISPRLRGRVSSSEYQQGLALCENFEVTPQGSLEFRNGTKFIGDADAETVIKTFIRGVGEDVIVRISNDSIRLYDKTGRLNVARLPDLEDPEFNYGFEFWDVGEVENPVESPDSEGRDTTPIIEPVLGKGVRVRLYNHNNINNPSPVVSSVRIAQTFFNSERAENFGFSCKITFGGGAFISPQNKAAEVEILWQVNGLDTERETFKSSDVPNSDGSVTINVEKGLSMRTGFATLAFIVRANETIFPTVSDIKIENIVYEATEPEIEPSFFVTPSDWVLPDFYMKPIQICQDSAIGLMILCVDGGAPYTLKNDGNRWGFDLFNLVSEDDILRDNPPKSCTFHQGRLWLGGGPKNPNTLYASETFNYFNFVVPEVPVDSSPLEFLLSSNGSIQWLEGLKNLLIGTDRGELIGRSSGSVISTTDFDFSLEQTWGSASIQPLEIGNQVMYVMPSRNRIRSLFDAGDNTNGYGSEDVTFPVDSTLKARIVDIAFQKDPDYLMYVLLDDGTLLASTYYLAGQVNAWHKVKTQGEVKSICTTQEVDGTALWITVKRRDGRFSNDFDHYLEVKMPKTTLGSNLDCYTTQEVDEDRLLVGLDLYNDLYEGVIQIVVVAEEDGEPQGYQVFTDINIRDDEYQLPEYVPVGATAYIGFKYDGKIKTLPVEGSSKIGSAQVQKRRFNEIFLRLFDSSIPLVNGVYPPLRTPESLMNFSQPLYTGDTSTYDSGFNDGSIEINQALPLPLNITAIFGKLKGSAI